MKAAREWYFQVEKESIAHEVIPGHSFNVLQGMVLDAENQKVQQLGFDNLVTIPVQTTECKAILKESVQNSKCGHVSADQVMSCLGKKKWKRLPGKENGAFNREDVPNHRKALMGRKRQWQLQDEDSEQECPGEMSKRFNELGNSQHEITVEVGEASLKWAQSDQ